MKKYGILFSIFGFLSVALGAFGAHGLKTILDENALTIYHTAVTYQFYHTLALGIVLLLAENRPIKYLQRAAACFTFGIVIFSGSLYTLALTKIAILGAITPIGGLLFLIGWVFVGIAFVNVKNESCTKPLAGSFNHEKRNQIKKYTAL